MSKPNEERDIYYIPPNFLASGRLFGGMIRARNAIEACVLVLLTGIPIIKLPMSLTVRIIILCLLPLPLGIFGIIGFEGDSLSEFAINWVRWFIHRRNLYRSDVTIPETARKQKKRIWEQEATKPPEELGIRIKQPRKKRKRPAKTEKQLNKNNRKMVPSHKKQVTYSEDFVPVKDIRNGIIEMEDGRYIRVLEVEPINFLLRSTSEQKNIVASFASWMKISPIKIQIKVLTKKADIGKHLSTIERDMESESNPKCRELQLDYAKKGITHNNESLIDPDHPDRYREMPLLGDVYEILMESPETKRMGNILNRLVNGSAKTFNQHTNVQLDNLYTVLDISELTGELLPVGMFVALDYVWDKAKEDRTKEKAIFIDEAWELIGDDDTNNPNNTKALAGEWVQEIFKIIRGYGGAAIAATQDIGDLDRSRFGKGILNVAKTKIILNLENDEAQRVQHILHLSDAEIMSITRFERGQGLISTNSNHITVSFKASPLEKQLITTDRMELNQILQEKMAQNAHNADL